MAILPAACLACILAAPLPPPNPTEPAPTAGNLVAACAEALGGRDRIASIRTLRVTWRPAGTQDPLVDEIERPRRFNRTQPGRDFRLLFDGRQAVLWGEITPGADPGPKLMKDPEEPMDVDNDIAMLFPVLFDHPCTYEGPDEIDGIPSHRLRLVTPSGVELNYHLDRRTHVPVGLTPRFTRSGQTWNNIRLFSDYRKVDGFLYPHAITGVTPERRYTHRIERLELNPRLAEDGFRVPPDARPEVDIPLATQAAVLVARSAAALGGMDKLQALRTLRVTTTYPDHARPVVQEFRRPDAILNVGPGLLFDGRRAAKAGPGGAVEGPNPALSTPENLQHFELDIAFLFPAFLDRPAEYAGRETVDGRRAHKLRVTLPRGARATYFLDTQTYLPVKVMGETTPPGKPYRAERTYRDFRATDGLLFPRAFTYAGKAGAREATVDRLELNIETPPERFQIPDARP